MYDREQVNLLEIAEKRIIESEGGKIILLAVTS
ncbi:hypothetical protein ES708_13462 [subsurface metagenome]